MAIKKSTKGGSASGGKQPIYRFHKIKVHDNRWLIWAIAYSLIVAIATVGYIKVTDLQFEKQYADTEFRPWRSYTNSGLGFSVKYPADWSIESDDASSLTFLPTDSPDAGVTVIVTQPSAESEIRSGLNIRKEGRTILDGVNSAFISSALENGHSEAIIMSLHDHKLYVIRGTESFVKKLALTFHYLK